MERLNKKDELNDFSHWKDERILESGAFVNLEKEESKESQKDKKRYTIYPIILMKDWNLYLKGRSLFWVAEDYFPGENQTDYDMVLQEKEKLNLFDVLCIASTITMMKSWWWESLLNEIKEPEITCCIGNQIAACNIQCEWIQNTIDFIYDLKSTSLKRIVKERNEKSNNEKSRDELFDLNFDLNLNFNNETPESVLKEKNEKNILIEYLSKSCCEQSELTKKMSFEFKALQLEYQEIISLKDKSKRMFEWISKSCFFFLICEKLYGVLLLFPWVQFSERKFITKTIDACFRILLDYKNSSKGILSIYKHSSCNLSESFVKEKCVESYNLVLDQFKRLIPNNDMLKDGVIENMLKHKTSKIYQSIQGKHLFQSNEFSKSISILKEIKKYSQSVLSGSERKEKVGKNAKFSSSQSLSSSSLISSMSSIETEKMFHGSFEF